MVSYTVVLFGGGESFAVVGKDLSLAILILRQNHAQFFSSGISIQDELTGR